MAKTYDRVKLHAALDHVLDAKKYAKDSSEIDEAEAFDIGLYDAEKGRAANPRPDWTPWLKKAYGEGYKSGSKKAK